MPSWKDNNINKDNDYIHTTNVSMAGETCGTEQKMHHIMNEWMNKCEWIWMDVNECKYILVRM